MKIFDYSMLHRNNYYYQAKFRETLQILSLVFLILSFEILQIHGFGRLFFVFYLSGLVFLSFINLKDLLNIKSVIAVVSKGSILVGVFLLLTVSFIHLNSFDIINIIGDKSTYLIIFSLWVTLILHTLKILSFAKLSNLTKSINLENVLFIIVCIVLSFVINLECFNLWPRWDTFSYYNAIESLNAGNIFMAGKEGIIVCGHISNSFALFSLFFKSLPGISNLNALYLSNMFLMFFDMILFYFFFKELLPIRKKISLYLIAIAGGVSPYILGTIGVINPEKIYMTSLLLLFYSLIKSNRILSIISAFIVCNVKETGVPVIAVITCVQIIYNLVDNHLQKIKLYKIAWLYYLSILTIGLSWFFQYKQVNWSEAVSAGRQVTFPITDGSEFNKFGFSGTHIKDTLIGALVTNFNWIFSFVIIVSLIALVILICKKQYKICDILLKNRMYILIFASGFTLLSVMCLFVTYHFYRYYTPIFAIIYILGISGLVFLFKLLKLNRAVYNICISCIALFLGIQSFTTIDPIMLSVLPTLDTGKSKLAILPINMQNFNDPAFMDSANYNRQITYFDKAFDKVLSGIELDYDTKIILSDEYVAKVGLGSLYTIWGFGYSHVRLPMWGQWNEEKSYRYLSYSSDNAIDPDYVSSDTDINKYTDLYNNIYYIEMPWEDNVINELKVKQNKVSLSKVIEYKGWIFKLYSIK